jgi:hypothetical protein
MADCVVASFTAPGGLLGLAVVGKDHRSVGDREHICTKGVALLVCAAVPREGLPVLQAPPVHGENLGGLDAETVDRDAKIAVWVRCAARIGREPTIAREGWLLDHDRGSPVDPDDGAIHRRGADRHALLRVVRGRVHLGGTDGHCAVRAWRQGVGDPVGDPGGHGARRQGQVDFDRDHTR